ncbi:MAG TPA: hypothetical protein VK960_10185 [Acidimicrobiia bacterium]|nr:hypothetical protein [Acidimicrobiia bacterium]
MTTPIVFISHSTVNEGRLDAFREVGEQTFALMEATKPGTVLHYGYLSQDQSEVSFVHVFPDAAAMDAHFVGSDERVEAASEYITVRRFEVYGSPSEEALAALRGSGAELIVHPAGFGGYIRLVGDL